MSIPNMLIVLTIGLTLVICVLLADSALSNTDALRHDALMLFNADDRKKILTHRRNCGTIEIVTHDPHHTGMYYLAYRHYIYCLDHSIKKDICLKTYYYNDHLDHYGFCTSRRS